MTGADTGARALRQDVDHVGQADRLLQVVGDEQHRQMLPLDPPEQILGDACADDRVQRGKRLVHEKELRLEREHLSDRHALSLAAGQLQGIAIAEVTQPEQRQPTFCRLVGALGRRSMDPEPQRNVLARGAPGEKRVVLEEKAHVLPLDVELHLAGTHRLKLHDGSQDARLPGARRSHQARELAGLHLEVDPFEHWISSVPQRQAADA